MTLRDPFKGSYDYRGSFKGVPFKGSYMGPYRV